MGISQTLALRIGLGNQVSWPVHAGGANSGNMVSVDYIAPFLWNCTHYIEHWIIFLRICNRLRPVYDTTRRARPGRQSPFPYIPSPIYGHSHFPHYSPCFIHKGPHLQLQSESHGNRGLPSISHRKDKLDSDIKQRLRPARRHEQRAINSTTSLAGYMKRHRRSTTQPPRETSDPAQSERSFWMVVVWVGLLEVASLMNSDVRGRELYRVGRLDWYSGLTSGRFAGGQDADAECGNGRRDAGGSFLNDDCRDLRFVQIDAAS